MDCDRCRAALSAALDGEDAGADDAEVRGHLAGCAGARRSRPARSSSTGPRGSPPPSGCRTSPTRSWPRIGNEPDPVAVDDRTRFLRISLAIIGAIQLAMAVPALVLGDDAGLPTHAARHLGSFALALGVGLLVVAWKPDRAPGVLPVVAALVACLIGSSILDIVQRVATPGAEVGHAPELVGLVAVWLLARAPEEHRDIGPVRCSDDGPDGGRPARRELIRTLRRVLTVTVLAAVIVGVWAVPAFAHAVLEGTSPGAGTTLKRSPSHITLTFGEPVEASLGAIRVFNSRAQPRRRRRADAPERQGQRGQRLDAQARRRHVRRHLAGHLRGLAPGAGGVHVHRRIVRDHDEAGPGSRRSACSPTRVGAPRSACSSPSRGSARSPASRS